MRFTQKIVIVALLPPLVFGCEGESAQPKLIVGDELPLGLVLDSEVNPVIQTEDISDGAVNGYVLTSYTGYGEHVVDGSEITFHGTYRTTVEGIYQDGFNDIPNSLSHCAGSFFRLDENGRVQEHGGFCYNVWRDYYTVENGLIRSEGNTTYTHTKGVLTKIESPEIESQFTNNALGQITSSEYITRDANGTIETEKYYSHIYDDMGQRVQTTFTGLENVGLPRRTTTTEYVYDSNGNNTKEIVMNASGEIVGETTFLYEASERPVVNLRLRDLLYFSL